MTRKSLSICIFAILALGGCVTTQAHEEEIEVPSDQMQAFLADKPEPARRLYAKVLTQGQRNIVLNNMRAGLAAMELGAYDAAKLSFDETLIDIESVYAENPDAEAARSLWIKENRKDFKGEPYERAMAYYYRGLLYMLDGDYENARASFRGGLIQDSLAEDTTYSQDFALLAFLDGWASHCNGDADMAQSSFEEAVKYNPNLPVPTADSNTLLIAETGRAPVKVADGEYGELLTFSRNAGFIDDGAQAVFSGRPIELVRAEDLYFQASTRGGRQIDHILDGKATFKDGANTAGDVLITAGATTALVGNSYGNNKAVYAGAIMAIGGLIAKGIAAATRPDADIRYWDNLPDSVHIATFAHADRPDVGSVVFLARDGVSAVSDKQAFRLRHAGKCSLGWVRAHSALDVPDAAPGSSADAPTN
jgi:tetratricopeptide (TPR) repeat protein